MWLQLDSESLLRSIVRQIRAHRIRRQNPYLTTHTDSEVPAVLRGFVRVDAVLAHAVPPLPAAAIHRSLEVMSLNHEATAARPRARLSPDAVTDAAIAEIDTHGNAQLTMAGVAERAGVSGPALYKHVAGLAALRASVAVRVLTEMTETLTSAAVGRSGGQAVAAIMHAYRDYAISHPHRYAAVPPDPLRDPPMADAAQRQLAVIFAVLRGCGIEGTDAVHITRGLRAMVHGFTDIESSGGFGMAEDTNESFQRMVEGFLSTLPPSPAHTQENR